MPSLPTVHPRTTPFRAQTGTNSLTTLEKNKIKSVIITARKHFTFESEKRFFCKPRNHVTTRYHVTTHYVFWPFAGN
jgi:hypothetical protein